MCLIINIKTAPSPDIIITTRATTRRRRTQIHHDVRAMIPIRDITVRLILYIVLLKTAIPTVVDMKKLKRLKLYDDSFVDAYCPHQVSDQFTPCVNVMSKASVLTRKDEPKVREKWGPYFSTLGESKSDNKGRFVPEYLARTFLLENVFITKYGHMFDNKIQYSSGRHTDDDRVNPPNYHVKDVMNFTDKQLAIFNCTVFNLILPWGHVFGHQLMEYYQMLFMIKGLLDAYPRSIILSKEGDIGRPGGNFYSLFLAMNISTSNYHVEIVRSDGYRAYWAPKTITTTSANGMYVWPEYIKALNNAADVIFPDLSKLGRKNIVLHDRRDMKTRNLTDGRKIETRLRDRYGATRQVMVLTGKESLHRCISMLRSAEVFISVHSSATANMLFLQGKGVYIEIQPNNFNYTVFLDIAVSIGWDAYLHVAKSGTQHSRVGIDVDFFMVEVFKIIDNL